MQLMKLSLIFALVTCLSTLAQPSVAENIGLAKEPVNWFPEKTSMVLSYSTSPKGERTDSSDLQQEVLDLILLPIASGVDDFSSWHCYIQKCTAGCWDRTRFAALAMTAVAKTWPHSYFLVLELDTHEPAKWDHVVQSIKSSSVHHIRFEGNIILKLRGKHRDSSSEIDLSGTKSYFCIADVGLLLCATDLKTLKTLVHRRNMHPQTRLCLREDLREWNFVNHTANVWALRHFEQSKVGDLRLNPRFELKDSLMPHDPAAIGVVLDIESSAVRLFYESETEGSKRLLSRWLINDFKINQEQFTVETIDSKTTLVTFNMSSYKDNYGTLPFAISSDVYLIRFSRPYRGLCSRQSIQRKAGMTWHIVWHGLAN